MTSNKYNFHTHTVYCDGADTPDSIVKKAVDLGFCAIGFSGHSYAECDMPVCMTPESTRIYKREIGELKTEYKKKINVYLGIERDLFSAVDTHEFDYVIGAVHYLKLGDKYYSIDHNRESFEKLMSAVNDPMTAVKEYYELVGSIPEKMNADIIAHFDLITKFNDGKTYFDDECDEYRKYAAAALEKVRSVPLEVNTGAIARGVKKTPYPSQYLLKLWHDLGGGVVYSSDCHDKEKLDFAYDDALEYIKAAGFERFLTPEEIIGR